MNYIKFLGSYLENKVTSDIPYDVPINGWIQKIVEKK